MPVVSHRGRPVTLGQPLTVGAWSGFDSGMSKALMAMSDVVSFHGYDGQDGFYVTKLLLRNREVVGREHREV